MGRGRGEWGRQEHVHGRGLAILQMLKNVNELQNSDAFVSHRTPAYERMYGWPGLGTLGQG